MVPRDAEARGHVTGEGCGSACAVPTVKQHNARRTHRGRPFHISADAISGTSRAATPRQ
jgi:hypothetical protein